jgi:ABC-type nitrate/sulfonate/bicarbonate transport system substrate-binding protein
MGKRRIVIGSMGIVLTLVLALVALRPPAAQPARKTIKMGTVGLESVYYSPVVLAMQKGYFEKEGLQVELVKPTPIGQGRRRRLAADRTPEVAAESPPRERGADVTVVASSSTAIPMTSW